MDHNTPREPQARLDFKTEMVKREQFAAHVPVALIAIGQHMLDNGLQIRGGVDVNKYDRRIQVTIATEDVETWETTGEVIGSKCSMVESPFGPAKHRRGVRVETAFRIGLVEIDLVSFHEVPADVAVLSTVGGGRS